MGVEWSSSRPCPLTPGETAPDAYWLGGWVCLEAGLDVTEKSLWLLLELEHNSSVAQPVAYSLYRLSYPGEG
jgi:hypothetical protein